MKKTALLLLSSLILLYFVLSCSTSVPADKIATIKIQNNHSTYPVRLILGDTEFLINDSYQINESQGTVIIESVSPLTSFNYNLNLSQGASINKDWLIQYNDGSWKNQTSVNALNNGLLFGTDKNYIITFTDPANVSITSL